MNNDDDDDEMQLVEGERHDIYSNHEEEESKSKKGKIRGRRWLNGPKDGHALLMEMRWTHP